MSPLLLLLLSVTNGELTVTSEEAFAGAISSVQWHGREFINNHDHGRELQTALSFDSFGECYNPTEAGSGPDGRKATSSSVLLEGSAAGKVMHTHTDMAFWMAPGEPYPRDCGHSKVRVAQNKTVTGGYTIDKTVTLQGSNIEIAMTIHVPRAHEGGVFEVLTGYMPPEFASFLIVKDSALEPISDGPGEQQFPVILSTPDRNYAMGAVCTGPGKITYGRFRFMNNPGSPGWNTVKWNAVYRQAHVEPGDYKFACTVAVGSANAARMALATRMASSSSPSNAR